MKTAFYLTLWITLTASTGLLFAAGQASEPAVDVIFKDFDHDHTPGCSLGVIRDNEFIYRRGYGMANLEHDIPLSSESVFRIGSTSKQFTALAIALLANAGNLSVDDPVRKHFPEFPAWAEAMTVSQLVWHTSGIRDYLELAWLAGLTEEADYFTDDWAIALLARQQETNFQPGDQYLYSNSGYLLLAHLVKGVTGQSLKDFAEERIFGPLGMKQTHFHDDHTHIVPGRAAGYAPSEEGFRISMTTLDIVGDGGVYTTIDDLLLWDRNFYGNRLGSGEADLIKQLTTPGVLNNGEALDYGFGLTVQHYRGLPMISHGGAFAGFRAEMIRFPEQRFSVAVLCNRSDGSPQEKARQVADHYLASLLEPKPDYIQDSTARAISLGESELKRYVGDFWEATEGFAAETRVDGGKLWAVHSPDRRSELAPVTPHRFRMLDVGADVIVTFVMGEAGIESMSRTINGRPRGVFNPFTRRQPDRSELDAYSGIYFSPELQVSYELKVLKDRLVFQVANQEPREITALFGEIFENPDWGSFRFVRGDNGDVTGFRLQSGRVRNLAFFRE